MALKTRHIEVKFKDKDKPQANFIVNPLLSALLYPQLLVKFHIEKQVSTEPNSASLVIHGLSPLHSSALDFVFDLNANKFGAVCTVNGGFLETGVKQLYSGVITDAVTVRDGAEFITKINLRNNYFELMRRPVRLKVAEGSSKALALITIIENAGGRISKEQESEINKRLGKDLYAEDDIIQGPFSAILDGFNRGTEKIDIYWDDAGVNFTPAGAYVEGRPVKIFSEQNGLIGNPEPNSRGYNFDLQLNGDLRISDPVQLESDVFNRLSASLGSAGFRKIGISSLYKIIHDGDNRMGEFKTSCESKFIDLFRQSGK